MIQSLATADCVFDRFVVQPSQRQLLIDGEPTKLGARAFDVLLTLIERRERAVSKNELLDLIWPNLVVEENNLQVHISALRKLLGPEVISTVPGCGYRFNARLRDAERVINQAPSNTSAPPVVSKKYVADTNLPQAHAALYGRDLDVSALEIMLANHRLVSIVGTGGIGKTRLAVAVANAVAKKFRDGVWLVELAAVSDPDLVIDTVARTLGLTLKPARGNETSPQQLARGIGDRNMLIVLDNGEHLLESIAEFAAAIRDAAPRVVILVTSQAALKVPHEHVYRLATLQIPDESTDAEKMMIARETGAVALFEARVRAVNPRFEVNADNLGAVIEICRRLDGIALAIELAAARVPLLGVEGLRLKLDDRFKLLTGGARLAPPRQQTLRAALDWSVSLLSAAEQKVFRQLSVFVGGMALPMAQYVVSDETLDEWAALEHLAALVDKSLVMVELVADDSTQPRYKLLESQRALAAEMLNDGGEGEGEGEAEAEVTAQRHAHAVLAGFEQAYSDYWRAPLDQLLRQVSPDLDNLRAALAWAHRTNTVEGRRVLIALAGGAWWLWKPSLLGTEGVRWCKAAMAVIDSATPPDIEARLQYGFAVLSHQFAADKELPALQRAAELYRQLNRPRELYQTLALLAQKLAWRYDLTAASAAANAASEAYDAAAQAEHWPAIAREALLVARTYIFEAAGQPAEGEPLMEELVAIMRESGDARRLDAALIQLAENLFVQGKAAEAIRIRREVAERAECADQKPGHVQGNDDVSNLANLCAALTFRGDVDEARDIAKRVMPLLRRGDKIAPFADHFALLACKCDRFAAAAHIVGWVDARIELSGFGRELSEQRARDLTMDMLQGALEAGELVRLLADGATLSEDNIARVALGAG